MPSDIDVVITQSKGLEILLEQKLGATGRGLHEKVNSIQHQIDPALVKNIRWIATMRNKVVHEDFQLTSQAQFEQSCQRALDTLNTMQTNRSLSLQPIKRSNNIIRQSKPNHAKPRNQRNRRSEQPSTGSNFLWIVVIALGICGWFFLKNN